MNNTNTPPHRATGDTHEQFAANWLQQRGLQLLRRNYYCRRGEIDLIMRDRDTLVFVEVRYRRNRHHGSACETVTRRKQRRLWLCARHYLMQTGLHESVPCRFDVIGITTRDNGNANACADGLAVDWVRDAFSLES